MTLTVEAVAVATHAVKAWPPLWPSDETLCADIYPVKNPRCQARHQGYNQANSHKSKPSKQAQTLGQHFCFGLQHSHQCSSLEPKWKNVSQLSNLPARLKRPPKLPSSHETRREWFPTRQNVLAPLIVLRLLGKLQKLSRLQAMHTKLQTAKLTVSHPHRMTHSSRTSTPPLDTVGVGWSTRKYCRQSSQATRRCRLAGWVLRRAGQSLRT